MVRLQRREKSVGVENTGLKSEIQFVPSQLRGRWAWEMQMSCLVPQLCSRESGLQVLFGWSVQLSLWLGQDSHIGLCVKGVC